METWRSAEQVDAPSRVREGMRADPQVHADIARGAAPDAARTPDRQAQRRALVHAGGDIDGEGLLLDAATLAAAVAARRRDLLSAPAAKGARRGGHHLAKDRLAHTAHLGRRLGMWCR